MAKPPTNELLEILKEIRLSNKILAKISDDTSNMSKSMNELKKESVFEKKSSTSRIDAEHETTSDDDSISELVKKISYRLRLDELNLAHKKRTH